MVAMPSQQARHNRTVVCPVQAQDWVSVAGGSPVASSYLAAAPPARDEVDDRPHRYRRQATITATHCVLVEAEQVHGARVGTRCGLHVAILMLCLVQT